jgi:hypothetical protein
LLVAVAVAAAPLALLGVGGHVAEAQELPGDPHSPLVAELAGSALAALDVSGFTGDASESAGYRRALLATAEETAEVIGANPREMQLAWLAADEPHQVALLTALTQLGVAYRSQASNPGVGFDCSGLTSYAWSEAGIELSRRSGDQIAQAASRDEETAMAGDLVQYPGHVMLYLGADDAVVHSSNPENDVELWVMSDGRADSVRFGDPTVDE